MSKSITKLNKNSKLFLLREAPQTLFPKLFKAWNITHLVFEKDTDAYARDRDAEILKMATEAGVQVIIRSGRTLWDSDEVVEKNHGKPTMSITQLQAAGTKIGDVPRPIPSPKSLPDPGEMELDSEQDQPLQEPDFNRASRKERDKSYERISGPNGDFAIPTMRELGIPAATTPHRGGESVALSMLDKIVSDKKYTATFEKPKTAPTAFEPQATTLLSPYLHFGALSVREFYWRVQDIVSSYPKGKASQPPVSLTGQLFFRDMYFAAQAALGYSFGQTMYNSHCRFIPWHLPSQINHETKLPISSYHVDSPEAERWFQRWKYGLTGFPWIDALMRQLRQEGWIHHLGRHAVACFLTRGGCYVSWERGAEVFEEWLIDHETACNAGNWQWLSCTAFYAQFYRCYSPVAFPQKWDKEGDFVRRYVPELGKLDKKYIYEPWKAPLQGLKRAGVKIQGDGEKQDEGIYPKRIFDFGERRTICLDGMKKAYGVGLYGDDKRVIDGSWRKLFDDDAEGPTQGKTFEDAINEKGKGMVVRDGGDKLGKEDEGTVEEDEKGAQDDGGENKGGDEGKKGAKRKGQGTLDQHIKRTKK